MYQLRKWVGHSTDVDIDQLPDAVPRGNFQPVKVDTGKPTFVTHDIETTDLSKNEWGQKVSF